MNRFNKDYQFSTLGDLNRITYHTVHFAVGRPCFLDPTCGAGEYLLAALEIKIDLLKKCKRLPIVLYKR